jgi:hypothetical protein
MSDRPHHLFRGLVTFFTDEIAPDILGLAEDGFKYRKLLGRSTRREARDAVEYLRGIVWGQILLTGDTDLDDDTEAEDLLFVTVDDLARRAGHDQSYIRRLCRSGVLRSQKARGRHLIERDAAESWLAQRKRL